MESLVIHDILSHAFAGRKVFVTGHTGFKGTWLCWWLIELGAKVMGFSLDLVSSPSLFETTGLGREVIDRRGDIRDFRALTESMAEFQPEAVFHLAAQPLVRLSYKQPRETFATNVLGSLNVFEAVRQTPSLRACINVTSDKCYENREWLWGYREIDPMGGHDPYSASKGCVELAATAWQRSFFGPEGRVGFASVRAGNVIGGGDWGDGRLVPDCLRAFAAGENVTLRYPHAIRPWQHVLEPLSGYLLLCARLFEAPGRFAGAWNFGPSADETWTVEDVVRRLATLWGAGLGFTVQSDGNPHEANWLKLDCSKAAIQLGWKAKWPVAKVLESTVNWYKSYYNKAPTAILRSMAINQIHEYCAISKGNKLFCDRCN